MDLTWNSRINFFSLFLLVSAPSDGYDEYQHLGNCPILQVTSGGHMEQFVGTYWPWTSPGTAEVFSISLADWYGKSQILKHTRFHTARKLGDVKLYLVFVPLRSMLQNATNKMIHSNEGVHSLNDWEELIYFTFIIFLMNYSNNWGVYSVSLNS